MLGVGLRKLCPQDSFFYVFRKEKLYENRSPEGAKPACGGPPGGLRRALLRELAPTWPPRPLGSRVWAALGALLGRLWRSWNRLGASRASPGRLLGVMLGPPKG